VAADEPDVAGATDAPAVVPVAPDPQSGDVIGGYALVELLGRGGAALVFRARRRRDDAIVALKVLAADKVSRPRIVQRFLDEAEIASHVRHTAIVEFVELVDVASPRRLAYAMEYVAGQSLRERLQLGTAMPLLEVIHVAKQLAGGLGALHAAGIVHRDLKPENVMLVVERGRPTRVKLLDFGVAKHVSQASDPHTPGKVDTPGTFVGTPRYMAPEQAAGGKVDGRADLFALGVMLFEMVAGQRPHEGDTLKAVVMAKLKGAPRLTMNPDREVLPAELAELVDACLKLQPDARPADTGAVIRVLDEAATVLSIVGTVRMGDGKMVREVTGLAPRDPRPGATASSWVASGAATPILPIPALGAAVVGESAGSAVGAAGPGSFTPGAASGGSSAGPGPVSGRPVMDPGTRLFLARLALALVVAVAVAVAVAAGLLYVGARDDVYVVPPTR
jgi:hypothetical protein